MMDKLLHNRLFQLATLGALISVANGCASAAKPIAMVPRHFNIGQQHPYSTTLQVTGGRQTDPMWKSDISSEAFAQAVSDAIMQSGVFSSVISQGHADYSLFITLVRVISPNMGFNMTATTVTEWRLTDSATGTVVSEEYISTSFTATLGDAATGIARVRVANEGAARENIKEGIRRLSELQLPEKPAGH